jgi:hypothetical protein
MQRQSRSKRDDEKKDETTARVLVLTDSPFECKMSAHTNARTKEPTCEYGDWCACICIPYSYALIHRSAHQEKRGTEESNRKNWGIMAYEAAREMREKVAL